MTTALWVIPGEDSSCQMEQISSWHALNLHFLPPPAQPLRLGPVNVRLSCKPLTPITLTATHIHDYAE
nr:MAG TPA: hypothetical protein [Caudoviricetes sp.]